MASKLEQLIQELCPDGVAIVLANHKNSKAGRDFANNGIAEARRKGLIKGPIEVWFSDKTKITY